MLEDALLKARYNRGHRDVLPRIIKKHNLAINNDNPAKRYIFDGGI